MKLTKETRNAVNIGSVLVDTMSKYKVTNMWTGANGRAVYVTLLCIEEFDTAHKWLEGRTIYGEPLSKLYGMQIQDGGQI